MNVECNSIIFIGSQLDKCYIIQLWWISNDLYYIWKFWKTYNQCGYTPEQKNTDVNVNISLSLHYLPQSKQSMVVIYNVIM